MNAMAALRQYQTVNTQAQVADASPHRLIQMLMEGGLSRLAQAKGAMLHGQAAQKGELISKAIGIIGGLREGLDLQRGGEVAANQLEDQEVSVLALHLLQMCLVYVNTLMLQQVLAEPAWWNLMCPEDLRALSPLIYAHINPYGVFDLDLSTRLPIEPLRKVA